MEQGKVDVVISYYRKAEFWPRVKAGLEANRNNIGQLIIVNDELWKPHELDLPQYIPTWLLDHPHDGWGAARSVNEGAAKVRTEYFIHIDADMVFEFESIAHSIADASPKCLLACRIKDVTDDAIVIPYRNGLSVKATTIQDELRPHVRWRKPIPLNMRHGHYLAHTDSWHELGGQDTTPPFDTEYHSMDYHLASRWARKFGLDTLKFGGGSAYHLGGIRQKPPEAESQANKDRVQEELELFMKQYPEQYTPLKWSLS